MVAVEWGRSSRAILAELRKPFPAPKGAEFPFTNIQDVRDVLAFAKNQPIRLGRHILTARYRSDRREILGSATTEALVYMQPVTLGEMTTTFGRLNISSSKPGFTASSSTQIDLRRLGHEYILEWNLAISSGNMHGNLGEMILRPLPREGVLNFLALQPHLWQANPFLLIPLYQLLS